MNAERQPGEHEVHLYGGLLHDYRHKLQKIDECGPDGNDLKREASLTMNHLQLETIRREREELNFLWANGRIGDNVHRNLQRELDLSGSRLA